MKIYDNYPIDLDFKKNEFKTLEIIRNWGLIGDPFQELANYIEKYYQIYFGANFNIYPFEIHMDFLMEVEEDIHRVIIGANIQGLSGINSYFIALCDREEEELIRKFHFDFASPQISTQQKVPTFHLQYGGKSTSQIKSKNIGDNRLDNWLSLPRLNFAPMNLALLLDTIFCEFTTTETQKIYENPTWRNLIWENEKFLYINYFTNLYNHINSVNYNNTYLIRDFYYGQ